MSIIGSAFSRPNSSGNTRGQFSRARRGVMPRYPPVKDKFLSPKSWLFCVKFGSFVPSFRAIFHFSCSEFCFIFGRFSHRFWHIFALLWYTPIYIAYFWTQTDLFSTNASKYMLIKTGVNFWHRGPFLPCQETIFVNKVVAICVKFRRQYQRYWRLNLILLEYGLTL